MGELQRLSPALWGLAEVGAAATATRAAAVDLVRARATAASAAVDDAAYLFPFLVTGTRAHLAAGRPGRGRRVGRRVAARVARARRSRARCRRSTTRAACVALADGVDRAGRGRAGRRPSAGWAARRRVWEGTWAALDLARCASRGRTGRPRPRGSPTARPRRGGVAPRRRPRGRRAPRRSSPATGARRGADDPWAPLTAREFEVARLVADGLTNAEIAAELGIAPQDRGAHVEHILAKLGVGRRAGDRGLGRLRRPVLHSRPHGDDREE